MGAPVLQGWRAPCLCRRVLNSIILRLCLQCAELAFTVLLAPLMPFFSASLPSHPEKENISFSITFSSESRRQQYVLCIYAENSPFCCLTNLCFTYVRNAEERGGEEEGKKHFFHNLLDVGLFSSSAFVSLSHSFHFLHSFHSAFGKREGISVFVYIFILFFFSIKIRNEKEKRRKKKHKTARGESDKRHTNTSSETMGNLVHKKEREREKSTDE